MSKTSSDPKMHNDFVFGTSGRLRSLREIVIDANMNRMGGLLDVNTAKIDDRFRPKLERGSINTS